MKKNKSQFKPGTYSVLPHALLDHPDFICLNWASQALLMRMIKSYNGFNNGNISAAKTEMGKWGFPSTTLRDAKKELLAQGWIIETRKGSKNKCSLYALAWYPLGDCKERIDFERSAYQERSLNPNILGISIKGNK